MSAEAGPSRGVDAGALAAEIDAERVVEDLRRMIAVPSVNPVDDAPRAGFREREMAELLADRMSDLGLEVGRSEAVPGRPNVWGRIAGRRAGPSLMLCGHLDTVGVDGYADPFAARLDDGRVYGRGSCDMKGALAAFLEVARVLGDAGLPLAGDLVLCGLADEEHQMIGSRDFGRHGPRVDCAVIGEPTELSICAAHKGQVGYLIRTFGRAVHSSRPELGVNAIEAMSRVIEAFRDYAAGLMARDAHPLCGHPRAGPGVIRGGTAVSTVPDFCELEVDRRTLPGETREEVVAEYRALLDALARADPEFRYELSGPTLDIGPLDTPVDSPLVRAVVRARERVLGEPSGLGAFSGGTDAPNLGVPAVIFGPGSVRQAHSTNEFVEVGDLVSAARVYLICALDLLGGQ